MLLLRKICFGLAYFVCLAWMTPASARVTDSAQLVPQEAVFMFAIESVDELTQALKQTSYYDLLFQDPGMKQFTGTARTRVQELLRKYVKAFWRDIKLDRPPEEMPRPHGRLVFQLFVETIEIDAPDKGGPASTGAKAEQRVADFQIGCLADMGSQIKDAQRIAKALFASSTGDDRERTKQRVRGVDLLIMQGKGGDPDRDAVCYGCKEQWLIAGSSVKYIERVLRQMSRGATGSLAALKGFPALAKALDPSHLFAFVNAEALRKFALDRAETSTARWKVENALTHLGLKNVQGLALSTLFVGHKQENYRIKMLLAVDGTRTGLPALLCPAPVDLQTNSRLLPKDTIMFLLANYDLSQIYDSAVDMVKNAWGVDITFFAQQILARTGQAQPPVDLQQDILSQLPGPRLRTWKMNKPYTDTSLSQTLFGIATQDRDRLDTALARIHQTYIALMDAKLQRKMLDHTIYLFPPAQVPSPFVPLELPEQEIRPKNLALSLANNQLVFGEIDVVEQAIRNETKRQQQTLLADPVFNYARGRFPAQAGGFFYRNDQTYMEIVWERARSQAGRPSAPQPARETGDLAQARAWIAEARKLRDMLDLGKLPDFSSVKKYFGPSVGYIKAHPLGVYYEEVVLKARQ